jgi:hypothetical protein
MSRHMRSATGQHVLKLTELHSALLEMGLTSQPASAEAAPQVADEATWSMTIERMAQAVFAGRDVCFIAFEPRLAWADLNLENLSRRSKTVQRGNLTYTVAFAERVSRHVLAEAATSQDFRHGGLLIAAIPEYPDQGITHFLDTLAQANAGFPAWEEWIRLPRAEITAILQQQIETKLGSNKEFMECVNDGERVHWYHPQPTVLTACLEELRAVAAAQGWQVVPPAR